MSINRDYSMNKAENYLTMVSSYPIIGTIPGVAKSLMGVVQAVVAIACATLCLIPCVMAGDHSLFNHNITHLIHGLSNIPMGLLEAIPLVGWALWKLREHQAKRVPGTYVYPTHTEEKKFLPYASLVKYSFVDLNGNYSSAAYNALNIYRQKVREHGGLELKIPLKTRSALAWEAANQASDEWYPKP